MKTVTEIKLPATIFSWLTQHYIVEAEQALMALQQVSEDWDDLVERKSAPAFSKRELNEAIIILSKTVLESGSYSHPPENFTPVLGVPIDNIRESEGGAEND